MVQEISEVDQLRAEVKRLREDLFNLMQKDCEFRDNQYAAYRELARTYQTIIKDLRVKCDKMRN